MSLERSMLRRTSLRIIPLLIACYFFAYLDRINISVAALGMNSDLGLSTAMFGLGAGLFFVSYFVFEIPSNLIMQRVGARRWIARIMLSWGLVSGATAFVQDATSFYVLRLLLGAAEAGFFPAVVLYMSQWFPQAHRARVFSYFLAALPLAGIVGSPLSGVIVGLDGAWGFHGWQWLFVLEAIPPVLLAPVAYMLLKDRPADAGWLPADERELLEQQLRGDDAGAEANRWRSLLDVRVIALALVHLCGNLAIYGLAFFLPQIMKTLGVTDLRAALLSAIPYVAGAAGMLYLGWRTAARPAARRVNAGLPFVLSAIGFALAAAASNPVVLLVAVSLAAFGCFGYAPGFWATPTSFLTGGALAVTIAAVNSVGNLGGFLGPYSIGSLRDSTGSFGFGLVASAGLMVLAAGLVQVAVSRRRPAPDEQPDPSLDRVPDRR